MIAPAESPESAPRQSWLDRWFEPPWRAFISWMVLAAGMGWVLQHGGGQLIQRTVDFLFNHLNAMLPAPLPPKMRRVAIASNVLLLLFWFEPVALRLNLLRGLALLSLRCGLVAVVGSLNMASADVLVLFSYLTSLALCVPVLHGWRTRPWMALVGSVLMAGVWLYFVSSHTLPVAWLAFPAMTFPYAAALIFGTRLIPRAAPETPGRGFLRW